jgi:hypothetical protein
LSTRLVETQKDFATSNQTSDEEQRTNLIF